MRNVVLGLVGLSCALVVGCSETLGPGGDADAGGVDAMPDAGARDAARVGDGPLADADTALDAVTRLDGVTTGDAETTDDAAATDDVGTGTDAAVGLDAGASADSGATDDSGTTTDSGMVADSGTTSDAGSAADSGTPSDAGSAADSGAPSDAGAAPDAGATSDAGICLCAGDADCDDGRPCNGTERCVACGCEAGPAATAGSPCSDSDACTLDDACDGAGSCAATDRGLDTCGAACFDLDADAMHCGNCADACAAGAVCAGGACVRWMSAGSPVNALPLPAATAHALGSDGTDAFVAWVGADGSARVSRSVGAAWSPVGTPIAPAAGAGPYIDLAFDGTTPMVLWGPSGGFRELHVTELAAGLWSDAGRSPYMGPCAVPFALALALDGGVPHVASVGAGGCGIGVAYAYATGATWWQTPVPPAVMTPGLLTLSGGWGIDVAWDGSRALLGMTEAGSRSVRVWQDLPAPGAWVRLGSALDITGPAPSGSPGTFLLSMAIDASGDPWVALADDDAAGRRGIYVQRFDRSAGDWRLVGGGAISDPLYDTDQPSIAFVGGSVYVAYVADVATVSQVFVSRWNGFRWQRLGPTINQDASVDAAMPYVADVAGAAMVAFREPGGSGTSGLVHVRALR